MAIQRKSLIGNLTAAKKAIMATTANVAGPVFTAKAKTAKVYTAKVNTAKVNTAKVNTAKVNTAKVNTAKVV